MTEALPEITLVVGIDAKTIEQLAVSWPTWKKNRPQLWSFHWLIFYDRDQLTQATALHASRVMGCPSPTMFVPWPPHGPAVQYASQREKMLAGHVIVPALHVRTDWHMKLDTDVLARPCEGWLRPEFFAPNEKGEPPSYCASKWHYTKGVGMLGALEDWGDVALAGTKKLGCRDWPNYSPTALRVGHQRMCSWIAFFRKELAVLTGVACSQTLGPCRIPVPSEDSLHWYVAARLGLFHRIANFKKDGWSNHSRIDELRRVAAEIMADNA